MKAAEKVKTAKSGGESKISGRKLGETAITSVSTVSSSGEKCNDGACAVSKTKRRIHAIWLASALAYGGGAAAAAKARRIMARSCIWRRQRRRIWRKLAARHTSKAMKNQCGICNMAASAYQ
jgi:hypothetical protein